MNLRCFVCILLLSARPQDLAFFFFFFNDTATTEIYTLSLHDALPISVEVGVLQGAVQLRPAHAPHAPQRIAADRKSTRLNSSHLGISHADFCLKKKNGPILERSGRGDFALRRRFTRFRQADLTVINTA